MCLDSYLGGINLPFPFPLPRKKVRSCPLRSTLWNVDFPHEGKKSKLISRGSKRKPWMVFLSLFLSACVRRLHKFSFGLTHILTEGESDSPLSLSFSFWQLWLKSYDQFWMLRWARHDRKGKYVFVQKYFFRENEAFLLKKNYLLPQTLPSLFFSISIFLTTVPHLDKRPPLEMRKLYFFATFVSQPPPPREKFFTLPVGHLGEIFYGLASRKRRQRSSPRSENRKFPSLLVPTLDHATDFP